MKTIRSYVAGAWAEGAGKAQTLVNPATEEPVAEVAAGPVDWSRAVAHARTRGGEALRALTFAERGQLLKALSKLIHAHRDELIGLAIRTAATRACDAKFDIDGASGTLAAYAELGAELGDEHFLVDGDGIQLGRARRASSASTSSVPRTGVAVHVNAFNFPAWGLAEKAAVRAPRRYAGDFEAGHEHRAGRRIASCELLVEAERLARGRALVGRGRRGRSPDAPRRAGRARLHRLERHRRDAARAEDVVAHSVRVNVEADSLNAAVLGPDVPRGSEALRLFVADVVRDMTQKAGQKCTAIRRVLVPADALEAVREDLGERLAALKVGDPVARRRRHGPGGDGAAASATYAPGSRGCAKRPTASSAATARVEPLGVPKGKGFFVAPVLLQLREADRRRRVVHEHEVFGPVATLIPYSGEADDAVALVARGGGGLVSSVYSRRSRVPRRDGSRAGAASRAALPRLDEARRPRRRARHGVAAARPRRPRRAGGGEELGGLRGLAFYLQRTAIAGDKPILEALFNQKPEDAE